jgi:S-adenosylmethionine hydrolase
MIYLFTDFGYHGPYVGEMQALLQRRLTHQQTTNLMHDAPRFNPRASAYLLAALAQQFEYGDICLAVVDPGVGDLIAGPSGWRWTGSTLLDQTTVY